MGPGELQDVLAGLKRQGPRELLVGLARSDDAAVYQITDEIAVVETVDFFPPIVDDAYVYGAIAAANSMSDVYAMGGRVIFALNIAGFPRDFPKRSSPRSSGGAPTRSPRPGASWPAATRSWTPSPSTASA